MRPPPLFQNHRGFSSFFRQIDLQDLYITLGSGLASLRSLHGVPRDGSPASTILWDAPTPRRPSRPVRILHEPIPSCRPWFAPLGRGRPTGGQGVVGSGLPIRIDDGNVGVSQVPWKPWWSLSVLFDPGGSGRLSGPRVSCLTRPPPVSTTKAPGVLYFRGSITRPLTSLSTLRKMGRPTTTQDSLLAAGPALPGGIRTRRVSAKGFRVQVSSSFPKLT